MDKSSILKELSELKPSEAGECFLSVIRKSVNQAILNVLSEEVFALCGLKHEQGVKRKNYRHGSKEISYRICGTSDKIRKPRVRRNLKDESSVEVPLETAKELQESSNLDDIVLRLLMHGTSTRDVAVVLDEDKSLSKSHVSRLLVSEGHKLLESFRARDFSSDKFLAIMLDGIYLSFDICVISAIGITESGDKKFLDFEVGNSENTESASVLMARIVKRGFQAPNGLLCVLDGSAALKKAVLKFFPDAVIQRCLIHKERNIRASLARKHWGELSHLFRNLRESQGYHAGKEKLNELKVFLKAKNQIAYESLL